jgi:hypothetical protein
LATSLQRNVGRSHVHSAARRAEATETVLSTLHALVSPGFVFSTVAHDD